MALQYRHEWKYEISWLDLLTIRQRLRAVCKPDPHAVDGKYLIRSLYFDTPTDKALREKIDGVNEREKFRIRYYNGDPDAVMHLEKKSKRSGLGTKQSAPLTPNEVQKILDGDLAWMAASPHALVRELYGKMQSENLRPKTIVDYVREPFIFAPGNVRVTFDYDLRTSLTCADFLKKDGVTFPAGDAPILMEVKWDNFLPAIIRDAVTVKGRRVGAFSKYAQCRIYG